MVCMGWWLLSGWAEGVFFGVLLGSALASAVGRLGLL